LPLRHCPVVVIVNRYVALANCTWVNLDLRSAPIVNDIVLNDGITGIKLRAMHTHIVERVIDSLVDHPCGLWPMASTRKADVVDHIIFDCPAIAVILSKDTHPEHIPTGS
jgi:hypothetical protein